jgi:hypothetical protein
MINSTTPPAQLADRGQCGHAPADRSHICRTLQRGAVQLCMPITVCSDRLQQTSGHIRLTVRYYLRRRGTHQQVLIQLQVAVQVGQLPRPVKGGVALGVCLVHLRPHVYQVVGLQAGPGQQSQAAYIM